MEDVLREAIEEVREMFEASEDRSRLQKLSFLDR